MLEQNQVTIKDLKVTGPLAGKKLEIQFDIKPIEKEKPKEKEKEKPKEEKKSSEKKSTDTGGLGLLFFLLFALIFTVAQTGGFSSLNYSESNIPERSQYRYQPAFR
ncbi:MAG: hypothetical protein WBA77_23170 [Microcoleaceae cyanobacterium]